MSTPGEQQGAGVGVLVVRIIAGVIAAGTGLVFLLTTWVAVSSRFGLGSEDPHGYGLLFGAAAAVVAGFLTAVVLPLAFPRRSWSRAYSTTLLTFAAVAVLLVAAVLTA
jgi:hypothetical protein